MADAAQGKVKIGAGTFDPGVQITLHYRTGDFPDAGNVGVPIAAVTIGEDGTAEFDGLEVGGRYWAVTSSPRWQAVAVSGKEDVQRRPRQTADQQADVRDFLKEQSQSQGELTQPPVEGMRSSVTQRPDRGQAAALAATNKETMESALRTDEALRGQNPADVDSIDRTALAAAEGVDAGLGGSSGVHTLDDHLAGVGADQPQPGVPAAPGSGLTAEERSERSKKAAATRRRNAKKRAAAKK